ncbi:peptidylprolyl isomerase [Aquibacillus rhizosphaerae]|uniref:Foldase protein PrsA n=1 Tax=Aquibacillus rhizosphaerae TaxID=3051431 RepID=A0ABT7LDX9_9BACI|nr:peptidylprolyl isomerase [Aquibacillus sp. LR5S19]MDL4842751.1 peptidylprolyl isomerase [Aquibacillus sp. LR5S19]
MKKLVMATTIAAGVLALSACSSDDPENVVETEAGNITKEEFYQELKSTSGESVLQKLVLVKVLEDNYEIDQSEIDSQIETYKEQYGDQWEAILQQSGYADEEAFREDLKVNLLQTKAVTEDIEVTEEELQQRYERMQTNLVASHILVGDEETANEVKEKLEAGEDFAALATEYSTDTTSAENGGELPEFGPGQMVPEFEDAAYNLEVDTISEPVETQHGFHIIKVTERNDVEDVEPFEDIEEDLRDQIASSKVTDAEAQAKLTQIMEDANIDVQIEEFEDLFEQPEVTEPEAEPETTEE